MVPILVAIYVLAFLILYIYVVPKLRYWNFPGPKPYHFLLGAFPEVLKSGYQLHHYLRQQSLQYGRVYQLWIMHHRLIVVSDAKDMEYLLCEADLPKAAGYLHAFSDVMPMGMHTGTREKHSDERKKICAGLDKNFLIGLFDNMTTAINLLFERLDVACQEGTAVDIDRVITKFTLAVIMRTAFTSEESYKIQLQDSATDVELSLEKIYETMFNTSVRYPFSKYLPYPEGYVEAKETMRSIIMKMLDSRMIETPEQKSSRKKDLMDIFLDLEGPKSEIKSLQPVIDKTLFFIIAGNDTISHSMAFFMYQVSLQPSIEARIVEEVQRIMGHDKCIPTLDDVREMKYMHACWKETLRRHSVVASGTIRRNDKDLELPSGHFLPRGVDVMFPLYVLHLDEEYWPNPMKFDPERFLSSDKEKRPSFAPQSIGPYSCMGKSIATIESVATLAAIYNRYKISLAFEPEELTEKHRNMTRPAVKSQGLPVKLTPRRSHIEQETKG